MTPWAAGSTTLELLSRAQRIIARMLLLTVAGCVSEGLRKVQLVGSTERATARFCQQESNPAERRIGSGAHETRGSPTRVFS